MKKKSLLFILPVLILLASCSPNNVYREYNDIKLLNWGKDQVQTFKVDIDNNSMPYDIKIGYRHTATIRKMIINTSVKMTSPSGSVSENSYKILIRDEQGFPLGETMGDISDIEVAVEESFTFPETGVYTFEVSHLEKEDVVSGVMEVGVVIDKAGN